MASPAELVEVQDTFDEFLADPKDGALVIMLGIITHWVVVVIHKEKGQCKQYLLDSLAHEYLHTPDELIPANVQEFYDKRCRIKGKEVVPYRVKMFTQLLTDLRIMYRIINNMVLGKENLKQLHVNTEMKIFWEEYEPVFASISQILDSLYDGKKAAESLQLLKGKMQTASKEKLEEVAHILYKWLVCHKPKFLRDGVMHELSVVGAKHLSPELKILAGLWWDIQVLILERAGLPVLKEPVDEDNQPKKVFEDYKAFLTDFRNILNK